MNSNRIEADVKSQDSKNTLKMQDKKKQIYKKKENVQQPNKMCCKITNYTFCTLIGEKYYPRRYFPFFNFAPMGLLTGSHPSWSSL